MTTFIDNFARPDSFIRFHGLTLLVVQNTGIKYVAAKPLNDLFGLAWRKTYETIQEGDNLELYGTRQLVPLNFDVCEDLKVSQNPSSPEAEGGEGAGKASSRAAFFMRLDSVYMFMARINTSRVRANGNVSAANFLLTLQKEWRQVLYEYETNGFVAKKESRADLQAWFKTRLIAETTQEKAAISSLIKKGFADIGEPFEEEAQKEIDLT